MLTDANHVHHNLDTPSAVRSQGFSEMTYIGALLHSQHSGFITVRNVQGGVTFCLADKKDS